VGNTLSLKDRLSVLFGKELPKTVSRSHTLRDILIGLGIHGGLIAGAVAVKDHPELLDNIKSTFSHLNFGNIHAGNNSKHKNVDVITGTDTDMPIIKGIDMAGGNDPNWYPKGFLNDNQLTDKQKQQLVNKVNQQNENYFLQWLKNQ
jgi:hypothetical protein